MKLHVYLDDWLIRADTPEQAQLQAQTTFRCSSSWLDLQLREVRSHTKSRLPVHWDAVQHSTFHSGALPKMRLKVQSVHQYWMTNWNITARDFHRLLGMLVFMGFAGPARTAPSSFGPIVGRHSMVPEDRELVRPDSSSTVGLSEMAWWSSPAVLQGLPLVTKGRK